MYAYGSLPTAACKSLPFQAQQSHCQPLEGQSNSKHPLARHLHQSVLQRNAQLNNHKIMQQLRQVLKGKAPIDDLLR
jgi:hypothetical protein